MNDRPVEMVQGKFGRLPARVPCIECPLRKDSARGALGGWTPSMYVEALHGPADIACHKSAGFDPGDRARMRSCTGVAAYRASVDHDRIVEPPHPQSQTAAAVAAIDADPEQTAKGMCFDKPEDFLMHHVCAEGARQGYNVKPNQGG